jgi:ADP-ribose pyrophosphatase YjhB (NUDIX family)
VNTLLTLAYKLSTMVWKVTRPITVGVRVVLEQDGAFLLVKPSYQPVWTLPGGGVEPGETLEQSARREIAEEVGYIAAEFSLLGVYTNFTENKSDHIVVFTSSQIEPVAGHQPDAEIEAARFFSLADLPPNTAPGARRRLEEFQDGGLEAHYGSW